MFPKPLTFSGSRNGMKYGAETPTNAATTSQRTGSLTAERADTTVEPPGPSPERRGTGVFTVPGDCVAMTCSIGRATERH